MTQLGMKLSEIFVQDDGTIALGSLEGVISIRIALMLDSFHTLLVHPKVRTRPVVLGYIWNMPQQ